MSRNHAERQDEGKLDTVHSDGAGSVIFCCRRSSEEYESNYIKNLVEITPREELKRVRERYLMR